ncbi:hypothetical protein [Paeniglutamicibacter cryotolerans]|uniref:O-antigen ligase family protein n=1 Tax=Paeniglutamicibacter cryotolerans TaxID=670079 RepID=A0A839QMZ8_9MICC|nr:hypothetical protein [Paeniglutamicibacter cryotolerans]MBB2995995.1 hypothetical protein [Paeniglutamicibacter cryotolerans]
MKVIESGTASQNHALPGPTGRSRKHLPLTLLLLGFPLWWFLGLSAILPVVIAVPLAIQLSRKKNLVVPKGFGWWLLFLIWVLASSFLLWADAPGAVPGGGLSRIMVYGYRLSWYLSCTVVLLWIINSKKRDVSDTRVVRLIGWMFVVTVAGGLLGMILPKFEVTSLVEMILPRSLSSNGFVNSIVHPAAANLTTFLGRDEYRPIAPFAFANSWGSNLSMYLPFFVLGWFTADAGWRRFVGPVVLVLAVPPIVYSMNRGLWASLGLGLVILIGYLLIRGHRKHRLRIVVALVCAVTIGSVAFAMSPLAGTATERLDTAHSNDRRAQLLAQTVLSTAQGSPIVGFGSTRDVQGSFASIAGGGTPDCPACGVPPLGTQGHLWLVIFSQGLLGAVFFLLFFVRQAFQFCRVRSRIQLVGMTLLAFFAVQMFIYDTLGMPLFTIMIGVGLMWREALDSGSAKGVGLASYFPRTGKQVLVLAAALVLGAVAGGAVATARPAVYAAETSLLLAPTPLYLSGLSTTPAAQSITVDTEAALVLSESSLAKVQQAHPELSVAEIRSRVNISATPNTRILHIRYRDENPDRARGITALIASQYLTVRGDYLLQRRDQVLNDLQNQLIDLESLTPVAEGLQQPEATTALGLQDSIIDLTVSDTSAGEVLSEVSSARIRNQPEVLIVSLGLIGFLAALVVERVMVRRSGRPVA